MRRCVIVGGATINNYKILEKYLNTDDYYIFCDSGLNHLSNMNIQPNLIVGDFDSHKCPETNIETIVLPCEKDDTDTVFAVKEGIKRGFDEFVLIGVVGQRFDHTFGNISILCMLDSLGKQAILIDDYSEMEIVSDKPKFIDDTFAYFSLLNISGVANGIYIENAKYNLENATITSEYQYGVSNEVLKNRVSKVYLKEGRLLLVKVFNLKN